MSIPENSYALRAAAGCGDWKRVDEIMEEFRKLEEELSKRIDFDAYQEFAHLTAIYPPGVALEYVTLGLSSEAGEIAGKVKKAIRDGVPVDFKEGLASELSDVLWYVAELATVIGFKLSDIADKGKRKLLSRKERGVLGGSGDNR